MPFKTEKVIAGRDIVRVRVLYEKERITNVGVANMTDSEAQRAIDDAEKRMIASLTKEIRDEFKGGESK